MRHNDIIYWKDKVALEMLIALFSSSIAKGLNLSYEQLAEHSYKAAEAMFNEREKDEHNPTQG